MAVDALPLDSFAERSGQLLDAQHLDRNFELPRQLELQTARERRIGSAQHEIDVAVFAEPAPGERADEPRLDARW